MIEDTAHHPAVQRTLTFPKGQRELRIREVRDILWYLGYKAEPVILIRDLLGRWRDEALVAADPTTTAEFLILGDRRRWSVVTTFQEARSYLGLETTRGRVRTTVLRAEPSLLALYTQVVWLYLELPARYRQAGAVAWSGKADVTFSDAITAVRRYLWVEGVFTMSGHREAFEKPGGPLQRILLRGLAPTS